MRSILIVTLIITSAAAFSQTGIDIMNKAEIFLNSLTPDQRNEITFEFSDSARTQWTNLPVGMAPRTGLQYGKLSFESRIAFHRVLSSFLSSQGYLKTTGIMHLDDVLNSVYDDALSKGQISEQMHQRMRDLQWGHENYFIAFWGQPQKETPWGFKIGGHHLSLNVTVQDEEFNMTPLFLGTDPSEVPTTQFAGWRVLSKEEDYGFMLINALDDAQKKVATLSREVPGDIITNPGSSQRIDDYYGIKAEDLSEHQRKLLQYIIEEYVHNLDHEKAHVEFQKILKAGIENVYFAWIGSYEAHQPHYYIVNGPTFLIEYDNVGFQQDGNHIHCIWREKDNDFGQDILRKHYELDH